MNIVILSEYDWCASGAKIRNALRSRGHRAILVKYDNRNGFDCDYEVRRQGDSRKILASGIIEIRQNYNYSIQDELNMADAVIFKGDEPPVRAWHGYIIPEHVKIVIVTSGSNFRRIALEKSACRARWDFGKYETADLKFANTPEMAYPEAGFRWMPMSFDCDDKPNLFTRENRHRKLIVIMHSPSNRKRKGTEMFIRAMQILRAKGNAFRVHIIEGKKVDECIKIKSNATIFYDQNRVGFYGNSAIEAMQFGIPTVAWISPAAKKQNRELFQECPIIDSGTSLMSMVRAFEFYLQNPGKLYQVSQKTKKYCNRLHSQAGTAKLWEDEISKLLS